MIKDKWITGALLFASIGCIKAEVSITEIMTNNVSTIVSDQYNYDGFVEFYNDGESVDLKGWTVKNIKEGELNWQVRLDSTHILPTGYSLLFFGKSETGSRSASKIQHNYVGRVGQKLSTDEGMIHFEKDGQEISLSYPSQYPHLSYCEAGFMTPSPGKENDPFVTVITNRVAAPLFKAGLPGLHEGSQIVELACATEGAKIYYTLNGDAPSPETGTLYNGPIAIEKTTVLRARAYKEEMLFSEILTGSFILPEENFNDCKALGERLPIVSLSANNEDLFSDMLGMYVKGTNGSTKGCYAVPYNFQQDWIRSANFEYILDGKVVDNQEVEIGVYGGCTRIHVAKSLKIKANKRSGKNKMNYTSFFAGRSYKKVKSLALRNGGNGYSYVVPRWRDMFIQHLADGMNLDKQVAQPVSFYLNGTYYGMMILTERTDEDYLYHNYGLDEEEIDLLSVNSAGYHIEVGTKDAYNEMINYASKNYDKAEFYDQMEKMMDVDEYVDYQILEQYVGNTDWVSNNTKIWRKRDGGRFRWIVYDTDFGLSKATAVDKDMIQFATSEKGTEPCWTLLKSCLKNEDFRWKFLDQYLDRLENQFTDERIDTKLDSIWNMTKRDMCATIKRSGFLDCPGNPDSYDLEIEKMRTFAKERKGYVVEQLKKDFGLGDDTVIIKVRTVFPNDETPDFSFLLNKRLHKELKYNAWAFSGERLKVEPEVPYGYKISRWEINNVAVKNEDGSKYLEETLTSKAESGEWKVTIYFEHDPNCVLPDHLCLNEICASNETTLDENGEAPDWIELYNGGDQAVDLAGMILENETKALRCTIPSGHSETVVPAGGYKLLWADKKAELGPLHLNFKLGATESEKISLRLYYHDSEVELSSLLYAPHQADESYGRETDGAATIQLFSKCMDDEGNELVTATPLSANGSVLCQNTAPVEESASDLCERALFVQGNTLTIMHAQGCDVRLYNLSGDCVATIKPDSDHYQTVLSLPGAYLVKIVDKCWKIVVE